MCRRKILDRRLTSRTRQSKLPFGTSVKLWSLCPLVDWSLVLSGSLGEAQMEEQAYRKLIAWLIFAGCWRPNTKYTGGWLPDGIQVSTHSSPPTHLPKEGETSLMLLIICNQRKERKEKKRGLSITTKPQRRAQTQFSQFGKENLMQVTFNLSDARWAILCLGLSANPSNSFCHDGSRALLKRKIQSLITEDNAPDYANCWSQKWLSFPVF